VEGAVRTLDRDGVAALLETLARDGYTVVGPTVRDGAIVYDRLSGVADLPRGWGDEQAPGHYRLVPRGDDALFGYAVGPHSWKKFLFPARQSLFRMHGRGEAATIRPAPLPEERFAFIGVRGCELAAIGVQDRVFMGESFTDEAYAARRADAFIVAVSCAVAGGTCFCASMGTGPRAGAGHDLALTEVIDDDAHYFTVEVGSAAGESLLAQLPARAASADETAAADAVVARTAASMGRQLETEGLHGLLMRNLEHPRWDEVADRCLGCANCTLACPTCFCSAVEDVTDLTGEEAERVRRWDSCFNQAFTYVVGGSVRSSTRARYRQWLTHKLDTWHDQFGTSGCVGCGRCITWCPVGIDLTEEAAAIRASDGLTAPGGEQ